MGTVAELQTSWPVVELQVLVTEFLPPSGSLQAPQIFLIESLQWIVILRWNISSYHGDRVVGDSGGG